jgi:hypothetical protein
MGAAEAGLFVHLALGVIHFEATTFSKWRLPRFSSSILSVHFLHRHRIPA